MELGRKPFPSCKLQTTAGSAVVNRCPGPGTGSLFSSPGTPLNTSPNYSLHRQQISSKCILENIFFSLLYIYLSFCTCQAPEDIVQVISSLWRMLPSSIPSSHLGQSIGAGSAPISLWFQYYCDFYSATHWVACVWRYSWLCCLLNSEQDFPSFSICSRIIHIIWTKWKSDWWINEKVKCLMFFNRFLENTEDTLSWWDGHCSTLRWINNMKFYYLKICLDSWGNIVKFSFQENLKW